MHPERLNAAIATAMPLAGTLFDTIRAATADGPGVSRAPYSAGEQSVIDILARQARTLELETRTDPFGNAYFTLPGKDRTRPGWITGSHVDSVPVGGNFDGLAGVIAGFAVAAAFRESGLRPDADVTIMGIRSEEASSWYGGHHDGHIGSRAALGMLPRTEIESAVNSRTGVTLASDMRTAGFDPDAVGRGTPYLDPARYRGYLELHIEQGPVLEARGLPVGVVTGIRGAARARSCRCLGEYTHSGAVPQEYRHDAVKATAELVHRLDVAWDEALAAGRDMVFTVGKFFTDASLHALTKVPGETGFTLDIRSRERAVLVDMIARAEGLAAEIGAARRVTFELGRFSLHEPAEMAAALRATMHEGCERLGIARMDIASGAGHDAQDFANVGFPSAMVFVRNGNGSHNAREAMALDDFRQGCAVLAWTMLAG